MKLCRLAAVAALALALSTAPADAKKKKNTIKECHADPDGTDLTTPAITPAATMLTPGKTTTVAPSTMPGTTPGNTPGSTKTPKPTGTVAPVSTTTPKPSKSKTPKASGLKVKLYKKKNFVGKKLVVNTENDVCYSVTSCFDDLASSIAWSKIPTEAASIELFKAAACADVSVVFTSLGTVGGNGSVASLDDFHFSDAASSFIVRSRTGKNEIKSQANACEGKDNDKDNGKDDAMDDGEDNDEEENEEDDEKEDEVAGEASEAPSTTKPPKASETPSTTKPGKSSGLKVKLYKKTDFDGKKLVVKTQSDVCYSVDACFDDLTSSLSWSKVPRDAKSIELFESAACADASVVISDLGAVGGNGSVASLKDLKFNKKLSSFVVRSTTGNGVISSQENGCSDDTDEDDEIASDASTTITPASTTEAPTSTTLTPVTTTQPPVATTQAPVAATVAPAATMEAPVATTQAPAATTDAPVASTQAPVVTTPATITVAPLTTTEVPMATTEAPVATTEAPVATTEAPMATTEAPVVSTQAPVVTTEAPAATTEAPVAPTVAPVTVTVIPTATTTEAPVATTETPVVTTETPVVITTSAPVLTTQAPVATTEAPGSTPPAPVAPTTASPAKTKGLKVKLYKKVDLEGDKVVVPTQNDVCYSVDACFDDKTTSLEWTKVTSDPKSIELFDLAGCTGASVSITALGDVGGGSSVGTLKDLKFNNKVSSFVVRSKTGGNTIVRQDDGCAAKADDA